MSSTNAPARNHPGQPRRRLQCVRSCVLLSRLPRGHRCSSFSNAISSAASFFNGWRSRRQARYRQRANSTDSSPRHRHNAVDQHSEATIHYRFHPNAGMALPVTACKVHRNVIVLLVGLPDSTLAIPEWMARPEAAALGLRSPPLIPVQHLRELRITLDSLLSSLSDDSISGGGHEATTGFRSTDFTSTEPTRS